MLKNLSNVRMLGTLTDLLRSFIALRPGGLQPLRDIRLTGSVQRVSGSMTTVISDSTTCCEQQCSLGRWISDVMLIALPEEFRPAEAMSLLPCTRIQNDLPSGNITDYDLALSLFGAKHHQADEK